jgi:transposase-like protein
MTDRKGRVADNVAFRLDYEEWCQRQSTRDQAIIADLSMGETTGEVAKKYGVSPALISQFRRKYADSWKVYITDKREMA